MMRDFVCPVPRLVGPISVHASNHDQITVAELLGFDGFVAEVSVAHVLTLMLF